MGNNWHNKSETTFVQRFKKSICLFPCWFRYFRRSPGSVLALSIFPVDLILLTSFLLIDLAEEKSMSLHSLYLTPFTEVGKSQLGLFLCHSLLNCPLLHHIINWKQQCSNVGASLTESCHTCAMGCKTLPSGSAMIQESSGFSHILCTYKYRKRTMRVMSTKIGRFCLNN